MHSFDRQTDRRTDRNLIVRPHLHSMQRGKNQLRLAKVIVKNKMSRFFMVQCVHMCRSSILVSVNIVALRLGHSVLGR